MRCEWVSPDGDKIVFPVQQSKGRKRSRVVYLDETARRIVARRVAHYGGTGPLFRNRCGNPLSKAALIGAIRKIRVATGIPGLCCYSFRHSWITRMLEKGVDVPTVAALAGNSPRMVMTHYSHVADNEARLLSMLG